MQQIKEQDILHDEYGNYYEVLAVQKDGDKVKALEVTNLFFKETFKTQAAGGEFSADSVLAAMNDRIAQVQQAERPIYALGDLLMNRIAIYAMDVTKPFSGSLA